MRVFHPDGPVVYDGAEDAAIEDCDFDQLGGTAIFMEPRDLFGPLVPERVLCRGGPFPYGV